MGEDGSVVKENGNPYLQYVWGKFWPNNHAHVMQGRNGFSTEMLYCLLSITDVSSIVTGAVQMKISQRSMSRLLTVIPSKSVCKKFNTIIRPIFDIIKRIREAKLKTRPPQSVRRKPTAYRFWPLPLPAHRVASQPLPLRITAVA